jgi:hypothetical protein
MKITVNWLRKEKACGEAIEEFKQQKETDSIKILKILIKQRRYSWANWFIMHIMKYKQYINYVFYAVEQALPIFEEKYPDNDRPRKAIEAAKKYIKYPSKKNKNIATIATAAVFYAAIAYAYTYGKNEIMEKILRYGIKLLEE